jgi:hypothetical protein
MTDATKMQDDNQDEGTDATPKEGTAKDSARSLAPLYLDAAKRILRREEADVMRQARKLAPAALRLWLVGFYMEHRDFVVSQLNPAALVSGWEPDFILDYSEKYAQSRYQEIDSVADAGAEALQARFDETRSARATEMAAHFTGGMI